MMNTNTKTKEKPMLINKTTLVLKNSSKSCKQAQKFLNDNNIKYVKKNVDKNMLSQNDIKDIITKTENGLDDIVSTRTKTFKKIFGTKKKLEESSMKKIMEVLYENQDLLKVPIIYNDKRFVVGYGEEISLFTKKKRRI